MRVPHFLLFTLGLSATLALFGCSRESSVKENVNLKNNHSRVFAFNEPIEDPQAFADSMANVAANEADTIPDTLTVTVNDTVYLIGLLPYNVDKIYRFQWTLTKKNGKDTVVIGDNAKPQAWAYAKPGLYEPKFVAFDGNNATDTAGTATRKSWIRVIDTKPTLIVPKDTLWTKHDGDITFPILASDSFGTIVDVMLDMDASGKKESAKTVKYKRYEDNDSLYITIKNKDAKIDSLGNQKIYVIVTDDDGNETKDSVNLHFNRIPRLKVIYPQDGARHNINDRFYFYYEGEDDDNPQDLQYFIYAQVSKNGQPPQKAFTDEDLIAKAFTSNIFEPLDANGKNNITLISDPGKAMTGRIYWDMYATDGYDIVRLTRISTGENTSRPWNFYIGDLSSTQGSFTGVVKYQGRTVHSGIHVEFNNGNKTFDAYTDSKGNYTVKADAGTYTATITSDSLKEYQSATVKDLFIESGSLFRMDEIELKDSVKPVLLVKNIDTLRIRNYNQTVYARDLGAGLASISATIDGATKKLGCNASEDSAVFNCALSLDSLLDDKHTFTYSATDKAGNKATLEQSIIVRATSIALSVNDAQNARIGLGEKLDFKATITGAYPEADSVTWNYTNGKEKKEAKTAVKNGVATLSLSAADLSSAMPDSTYYMTVTYASNGANESAQVKYGILGDNPAVIFTEPGFESTVSINDEINFKATAYKGNESTTLTLTWNCATNLTAGSTCPAAATIEDKGNSSTTLAFSKVGTYKIHVTVKDDKDNIGSDTVVVNVISDPPTIEATTESNSNEYKINSTVTVKASASDKYGTIKQIKWGCSNGMVVFDNDTTFATPAQSVNDVPLKVQLPSAEVSAFRCIFKAIDDDAEEGLDTLMFKTILDPPTVHLSTKKDTVKINSNQTIKANATDKLGYIAKYEVACSDNLSELKNPNWDEVASSQFTVRMPQTAAKAYYCVVQVTDDDGNTARDTAEYKVIVGLPTVTAYSNYNKVTIKDVVELNAHAQDSLGSIVKYEWGCGSASAENIGFTYSSPTTPHTTMTMPSTAQNGYKCIARVTDDDGNIAKDTVSIDIILAPPSIEVTKKSLTVREGYNITLNAEAYDNNNLPSDPGSIAKREWSCGTPEQIVSKWKTVSDFDTVWKAPAAETQFYCVARATDNDGNMVSDTMKISFSTDIPLIRVKEERIYINEGDGFSLDATVNDVWQGIDWFTWECQDKATGKTLESKVSKYDYAANGKSFKINKDSTYSEKGKDMNCIVSAQETSTKATFSDTTVVLLMQHHPTGVISAADTVYLWSGDEAVGDEGIYFYTPEWNAKKSLMGDLGDKNMQDYWWKFSNVDGNFYQGEKDGSIDTSIAEFNTAFIRKTREGSMTITLDYRDSTTTSPTRAFYSRHRAEEVSRKVYFRKAWKNIGKDTVIAKQSANTAPVMTFVNGTPIVAYNNGGKGVTAARYSESSNTWTVLEGVTLGDTASQIYATESNGNLYMAVLDISGKLTMIKSASGTSALAKIDSITGVATAKLISKSDDNPRLFTVASSDKKISMYDVNSNSLQKNTKFSTSGNAQDTQKYREVEAMYTSNGLIVVGVTTSYDGFYGYYGTDYKLKGNFEKFTSSINQVNLAADGKTLYIGYLSRDIDTYGPRIAKATINTSNVSWNMGSSTAISEGIIAYHMSLVINNKNVYVALDDNGRPDYSQVHVYRYDGSKWHPHGENQLPYFGTVFYNINNYYLRGWSPTLGIDGSGKIYVSMLARENAAKTTHNNNGPLVMKYVADNWEIK